MGDPVYAIDVALVLLVLGSLVTLAASRNSRICGWLSFGFVSLASISAWIAVIGTFTSGWREHTYLLFPGLGAALTFRVDPLNAIFVAILALVAPASALYSVRYMEHYTRDSVAKFYPVLLLCIAAMIGVLVSADMLCFLVFWETMTLTSYFLVTFERENAASQRAGLKYFVITHGATLCMAAGSLALWRISGSFHFDAVTQTLHGLIQTQPIQAHLLVFLFFIGFATKAGILPMGDWLPDAHPVAPSGMSAALSGVLVKLGIYGLLRLFCFFLPVSPSLQVWGIVIALTGTASLFVGNLTAMRQADIKRLMAFSTIGQIGYICLGLGVGAYCVAASPVLASVCLAGAILHTLNHACFKSCLFLGAGSVLYRTGTRDIAKLGGLGRFMPFTSAATTIASLSIAGVPPLNGFTSKWLIICGCILAGLQFPLFLLLGLIALFISIVSLATYLKFVGAVFLGNADEDRTATDVPASMMIPEVILASLCVLLGIFPNLPLHFIARALQGLPLGSTSAIAVGPLWGGITLGVGLEVAFWWPIVIFAGLAILAALCYGIQRLAHARVRSVPVWYCGEEHAASAVRYRGTRFFTPFETAFQGIYPTRRLPVPHMPAFLRRILDFDRWIYNPTAHGIEKAADDLSRTHVGTPQVYLLWIVIGAIAVVAITLMVAH